MKNKNIFIIGAGYVGIANGVLLAKRHKVTFIDLDKSKIDQLNNGVSPLKEPDLVRQTKSRQDNISATSNFRVITEGSLVLMALPTDYNEEQKFFDTKVLESMISKVAKHQPSAKILIKSTIPIGFTTRMRKKYDTMNIYFSPEFLREGRSFYDAAHPNRIIVSPSDDTGARIMNLIKGSVDIVDESNCLMMGTNEAESVKLFANTYLAMRVAFINEVDSYCMVKNLDSKSILDGICKDERIGEGYNNPSFGYGGYCFPKDTKQAKSSFEGVPESLITATVKSNEKRLEFIASEITSKAEDSVSFFRLNMKSDSDNIRQSSTYALLDLLKDRVKKILIYEPLLSDKRFAEFDNIEVIHNLNEFKEKSKIVIANRDSIELSDFNGIIFTRDIYNNN